MQKQHNTTTKQTKLWNHSQLTLTWRHERLCVKIHTCMGNSRFDKPASTYSMHARSTVPPNCKISIVFIMIFDDVCDQWMNEWPAVRTNHLTSPHLTCTHTCQTTAACSLGVCELNWRSGPSIRLVAFFFRVDRSSCPFPRVSLRRFLSLCLFQ